MPLKMQKKRDKCLRKLQEMEKKFYLELTVSQSELSDQIRIISIELEELINENDVSRTEDIA